MNVGLMGFHGVHEGDQARIIYRCVDGFLASQLIVFRLTTEAEARAVFDRQLDVLLDVFGPPCTDWRNLSAWHRFNLWMNGLYSPEILTSVDWNLEGDLSARLNTFGLGPGPDTWDVTIGIQGPADIRFLEDDGSVSRMRSPTVCLHGESD